jgi:hypothetical protein
MVILDALQTERDQGTSIPPRSLPYPLRDVVLIDALGHANFAQHDHRRLAGDGAF